MNLPDCRLLFLAFCPLLLQLLCQSRRGLCSSIAQFETTSLCPNGSGLSSRALKSHWLCAAACARLPDCGLFYLSQPAGLCYLGDSSCAGLALWAPGPCAAFRAVRPALEALVSQLGLRLLYRFTSHGLANLADPFKFCLRGGNVSIGAQGAEFVKSIDSYLTTETPGFDKVVNNGNQFSIFVRVKHPLNIVPTYATFKDCGSLTVAQDFYTESGSIFHQLFSPADGMSYRAKSPSVFANSSAASLMSIGVTYDVDHHANFFFNGSLYPAIPDQNLTKSGLGDSIFQCFYMGGYPGEAQYSVQGNVSCYALSTRLLTQAEFVQLDSWCSRD